jgi:hypothetical protein
MVNSDLQKYCRIVGTVEVINGGVFFPSNKVSVVYLHSYHTCHVRSFICIYILTVEFLNPEYPRMTGYVVVICCTDLYFNHTIRIDMSLVVKIECIDRIECIECIDCIDCIDRIEFLAFIDCIDCLGYIAVANVTV